MKRIITLPWLVLICIASAHADRILLRPPDGYGGVMMNGERYVTGQIFLKSYADTTELKRFGFRDFEPLGANAWHKKVKAIWPLIIDYDGLPECVQGLSYEKARNTVELYSSLKEDEEDTRSSCGMHIENYGVWYNAPVKYNAVISDYSGGYSGGYSGYRSRGCSSSPYWGSENRFNPNAHSYNTLSPTLLRPTIIGTTPANSFIHRRGGCYYGR